MLIDWFTVGAQALNFLILVWLLKRYLYQPILDAVDAREKRIAAQTADAIAKRAQAQQERDELLRKNEEFAQQRGALLSAAADEASAERQRLLDEARRAAEALLAQRRQALEREARELDQSVLRRTREEVFAIARKALVDLAGASLEERMCEVLARRLRILDDEAKERLAGAVRTSGEPVRVRSALALPPEQRQSLQDALNETLSTTVAVDFETDPVLISGIELSVNGQKLAWSINDYLLLMEKRLGELLRDEGTPQAQSAASSEAPQPEEKKR
ncbi:ATP synthase subunit b [Burkholderiales bacterium]|nr:ATP synthase subunit b [Burkholderiales bacterium]